MFTFLSSLWPVNNEQNILLSNLADSVRTFSIQYDDFELDDIFEYLEDSSFEEDVQKPFPSDNFYARIEYLDSLLHRGARILGKLIEKGDPCRYPINPQQHKTATQSFRAAVMRGRYEVDKWKHVSRNSVFVEIFNSAQIILQETSEWAERYVPRHEGTKHALENLVTESQSWLEPIYAPSRNEVRDLIGYMQSAIREYDFSLNQNKEFAFNIDDADLNAFKPFRLRIDSLYREWMTMDRQF